MKKLLSMKEFSRLSGIAQTTLRHWDALKVFLPAYRDPDTSYRYYSARQMMTVKFIATLSSLNIPLNIINAMQRGRTPKSIIHMLEQQEKVLDMEMLRLRERYALIHTRLELIRQGVRQNEAADTEEFVLVQSMQDMAYIQGNPNQWNGEDFFEPFTLFCQQANDLRINLNYPIAGYHESMDNFLQTPRKPERFVSIDPAGNRVCPAGQYLIGVTHGDYGEVGDLPDKMAQFAKKNALTFSGPVYTIYLHDEICMEDPSRYLVQLRVAVKRRL